MNDCYRLGIRCRASIQSMVCVGLAILCVATSVTAADTPPAGSLPLADQQQQVAERFRRLEELLLRLADMEADNNPERAALLRRAAKQGRDQFVLDKLNQAASALRQAQFKNAIDTQDSARGGLDQLLTLLLSEDRPQRLREEKERVAKLIKDLKVVERLQRSTRARNENGIDLQPLQDEQSQINDRAERLNRQLEPLTPNDENKQPESATPPAADSPDSQAPDSPAEQSSDSPAEQSPQSPSSESPPTASPDSPSDPSSESAQAKPPQTPQQEAQQELQQALQRMQQAAEELQRAQREPAAQQQRQAEEKLRAAIDRLEKILRQLREEEMQRELARLEARVRKMAQMQTKLLESTNQLVAIPQEQRDRQVDIRAGNLSLEQKKIVMEADRAMLLLREEGTSVAFPEVLAQVRADMDRVAGRLSTIKLDGVTTALQEDIVESLEEMLAALQQAQRDLEEQKQQDQPAGGQGQGAGGEDQQPLIEQIAELKLIRTMETRILATTERYARSLDEQNQNAEMLQMVRELAERQSSLYRITRDIVEKRNQ